MPLFNFTHSLLPQARSLLFDQSLKQGTVGKRIFPFKPTPKFFIVLNKDPREEDLLLFLSQSDPTYALRHTVLKTHLIRTNPTNLAEVIRTVMYSKLIEQEYQERICS
jgi:hypothetical protein